MQQEAKDNATEGKRWRQSLVLIVIFVLVAILSLQGNQPPAPLGRDAPADTFSALRARDALTRILGDERPHPTGSAANAAVRDRVIAEFARIGLDAQLQQRFVCGARTCATVDNILARIPGASSDNAVLLSAHYDSVAAGPGASDDGAGVAALIEVARALKTGPTLAHDVWLLANDGEELGLLGAQAFVREPEFANIATVVNLEARGTTGASLLIETQPGNAAIIDAVGRALPRPGGTSLDYEIYKTLPNDTDFTVYRREGRSGTNFAWALGASRYHTPLDNLAHLDSGSLQQHGDNMLAMVRELVAPSTDFDSNHDAVYFGLFGKTQIAWPATWNVALLICGLTGWLLLLVRLVRARQSRPLPMLGASLAVVAWPVLLSLLGWAMHVALAQLGAMPAMWTAQSNCLIATFLLLAIAPAILLARPMLRWFGAPALAAASLLPFALIATATVLAMPGASFAGLLPLIVGVLAGHLWLRRPALWAGVAAIVAALLLFPYAFYSYSAIGHAGLSAATVLMGLIALPLLPALAGIGRYTRWTGLVALAGLLLFAALAVVRPPFDADVPRPVNLIYVDSGQTHVFAAPFSALPANFLADTGFSSTAEAMVPWSTRTGRPGPSGPALPSPTIEIISDTHHQGRRHVQLRLRSNRGATEGELHLPDSVDMSSVRIQGQALAKPLRAGRTGAWPVSVIGLPAEGVLIEFEAEAGKPIELYAADKSWGVPDALTDVVHARNEVAVPIHGGDISIAWTRLELPPGR